MPFRSQAQRAYLYLHDPKLAAEFERATPKGTKLPNHVAQPAKKPKSKVRKVKKAGKG